MQLCKGALGVVRCGSDLGNICFCAASRAGAQSWPLGKHVPLARSDARSRFYSEDRRKAGVFAAEWVELPDASDTVNLGFVREAIGKSPTPPSMRINLFLENKLWEVYRVSSRSCLSWTSYPFGLDYDRLRNFSHGHGGYRPTRANRIELGSQFAPILAATIFHWLPS